MTARIPIEDHETLKLTAWELKNLHLPPVTTVTLYEGTPPVAFLRRRITSILEKNPWLTSRIVKQNTTDGVVALAYSKSFAVDSVLEQHFSVYESEDVGFSLGMPYEELVNCLRPIQCARSKPATDTNEALFKVAVIPIEVESKDGVQSKPLQQYISLPGFALMVSMNHTLGDGHTYYSLYNMLNVNSEVKALDPVRVPGFEAAKTDVIGRKETAMFSSAGVAFGILTTYLYTKLGRRRPRNICINEVDSRWLENEKANATHQAQVPFVSSNDALSSWFFRSMQSDTNIMVVNFRSRQPSILDLSESHVGNYEASLPYFPGDVETPALIRSSIRAVDGSFRTTRAGSPETKIPGFWKLLRNKTSIITNWATFYSDVNLHDDERAGGERTIKPKLHFPIMESDGIITSVWNNAIVFRPRAGQLGLLLITRLLDNSKEETEPEGPLGQRIV